MAGRATGDTEMRRRLVGAGRALVEAGGPAAVSMRKVAAEVGVAATAIYWHVGSREVLLGAVLDALIADLPRPAAQGRTPRARVASLARAMREQALATTHTQQLARELGRSAVLFLVGGFVLLEDNYRVAKPGRASTQDLWRQVDDPAIDPELRAAMSRATTPDALFDYTVDRLLAAILGD